jgi:serine/threonine protein kinase
MKDFTDQFSFKIVDKIAEGGMGAVYLALQCGVAGFEKRVVIKTLIDSLNADPRLTEMFINEAKLVANLIHINIVQIYQLGCLDGKYYFVLEWVDGLSLQEFLAIHDQRGLRPPPVLAMFIAGRLARGLAYAHECHDIEGRPLGIVHRDICPNNILITYEGVPKITDFGVAKSQQREESSGFISGKLRFMSPEQARGETVDFRSDIYSLGILLYQMLSGHPFRHPSTPETTMWSNARHGVVEWSLLPEDLDPDWVTTLECMLAPDPNQRYNSTTQLAQDLEYHIYKNGYGPTIVTLADYIHELLSGVPLHVEGTPSCMSPTVVLEKTLYQEP